jgi:hypothetical protein
MKTIYTILQCFQPHTGVVYPNRNLSNQHRITGPTPHSYPWVSHQLVGFKYQKGYDWLDSKFHCSYLESKEVPNKNAGNTGKKRGKLSPFHFRFRWRHFRLCHFMLRMRTRSLPMTSQSTSQSASNLTWAVPIYYFGGY